MLSSKQSAHNGSSNDMKRSVSMLFDMDDMDTDDGAGPSSRGGSLGERAPEVGTLATILRTRSDFELSCVRDVQAATEKYCLAASPRDVPRRADFLKYVAAYLASHGYAVTIRTTVGGGNGADCLRNLRHTFLLVGGRSEWGHHHAAHDLVIEPNFREHFDVARPTERYRDFHESIPSIFVGSLECMNRAVELITRCMAASFEEVGLAIPTWRQHHALISKWLPRRWEDSAVSAEDLEAWRAVCLRTQRDTARSESPTKPNRYNQRAKNLYVRS